MSLVTPDTTEFEWGKSTGDDHDSWNFNDNDITGNIDSHNNKCDSFRFDISFTNEDWTDIPFKHESKENKNKNENKNNDNDNDDDTVMTGQQNKDNDDNKDKNDDDTVMIGKEKKKARNPKLANVGRTKWSHNPRFETALNSLLLYVIV